MFQSPGKLNNNLVQQFSFKDESIIYVEEEMAEKNNVFMNGLNGDKHAAPEPVSEKAGRRSLQLKRQNPPAEPMAINDSENTQPEQKVSKEVEKPLAGNRTEKPCGRTPEEEKTSKESKEPRENKKPSQDSKNGKASAKQISDQKKAREGHKSKEEETINFKESESSVCQHNRTIVGKSQEPEDRHLLTREKNVPVQSVQSSNLDSGVQHEESNQENEDEGSQTETQANTPAKVNPNAFSCH